MTEKTSVLLVEDDDDLRASLETFLEIAGLEVAAVPNALSYYRALAERTFTVAVIDLGLPDEAGEVLVDFTRRTTGSKIVVVTARNTLGTRVDCYRGGADLFLAKPVDGRELEAAIRSLAGRSEPQDMEITQPSPAPKSWTLLRQERALIAPAGERLELRAMEFRFVLLLAQAAGETVSRRRLYDELYPGQGEGARQALESIVGRTRKAIALSCGGASPILTDHGFGYALSVPFETD